MKTIRIVCFEFGVEVDDLFKSKLSNKASLARKIIIYILYDNFSTEEIRQRMGLNSRNRVNQEIRWVRDRLVIDSPLRQKVRRLKIEINED